MAIKEAGTMTGQEALKIITQECRDLLEKIGHGSSAAERNDIVRDHLMNDMSNYGISVGEWTGTGEEETLAIINEVLAKEENNQ